MIIIIIIVILIITVINITIVHIFFRFVEKDLLRPGPYVIITRSAQAPSVPCRRKNHRHRAASFYLNVRFYFQFLFTHPSPPMVLT